MSFETNLKTLVTELREATTVADSQGNLVFCNDAWQALPAPMKQLAEDNLAQCQAGEFICSETAASVSIVHLGDYFVAIIHREEQQLIIKDRILNWLLASMSQNENVFISAAEALGKFLQWRWVAVTKFLPNNHAEILAHWDTDHIAENFDFHLINTPCEEVAKRETYTRYENLQQEFANYQPIIELGAKVYAGYVYRDNHQRVLGHIYLMHDQPMIDWVLAEETLHMVTTIVGSSISLFHQEAEVEKQRGLALTDKLTQLCNRLAFDTDISEAVDKAQRSIDDEFVLAIIDLDGMKQINDNEGHDQGDRLLKTYADMLKQIGREHDHAYRIGGDEFAFIFRSTGLAQESILRNRFRYAIEHVRRRRFSKVDASLGLVSSSEFPGDSQQLIKAADERMYQDKQSKT